MSSFCVSASIFALASSSSLILSYRASPCAVALCCRLALALAVLWLPAVAGGSARSAPTGAVADAPKSSRAALFQVTVTPRGRKRRAAMFFREETRRERVVLRQKKAEVSTFGRRLLTDQTRPASRGRGGEIVSRGTRAYLSSANRPCPMKKKHLRRCRPT